MMRSTPMRSRPKVAKRPDREQRLAERAARTMAQATPRKYVMSPVEKNSATPVRKDKPVRSEAYRRIVASLPCVICGISGFSQCAHANTGKGVGIKSSDLETFPACASRPGVVGCHQQLDHGALFDKYVRRVLEPVWAADTRRQIKAMGCWPASIEYPN